MAKLITAGGVETEVLPKNGKHFSLKEMQDFVGGLIEILYTEDGQPIVVNEEGKLNGSDVNHMATDMWRGKNRPRQDHIVGDALFCAKGEIE